jgi:hypothetical protein
MGNTESAAASGRPSSAISASLVKHVDGGYVQPASNLYPNAPVDYDERIVRKLIIERRLAPFYRGLAEPPASQKSRQPSPSTSTPIVQASAGVSTSAAAVRLPMAAAKATTATSPVTAEATSSPISREGERSWLTRQLSRFANQGDSNASLIPIHLYVDPIECPICFLVSSHC